MNNKYFTIITFYQFKIIKDKNDIITKLKDFCKFNKIKGTILIADEGINGTIAGLEKNINSFILYLENFNLKDGKLLEFIIIEKIFKCSHNFFTLL